MMPHDLVTAWQRILSPRGETFRPREAGAEIHRYDPIDDFAAWSRCRDRGQFHLGRARRAKDRGQYNEAAREIERALKYDDTSETYFQVLGQCLLNRATPDAAGARRALERAFALNPRNGYTIRLLMDAHLRDGNPEGARITAERAQAAGAPAGAWQPYMDRIGELSPVA
jgi:tetratricopeptide (TPR) repeat protein